jgi:hypothetical protein
MKTAFFSTVILATMSATAAIHPYWGAGLGYAFDMPGDALGFDHRFTMRDTVSTWSGETRHGSMGAHAFALEAHVGILSDGILGGELELELLKGSARDESSYSADYKTPTDNSNSSEKTRWNHSGVYLTPSVVLKGEGDIVPYGKFGPVFGLDMSATETTVGTGYYSSGIKEYSGGLAYGFHGAFGGEYRPNPHLAFFAELDARTLHWAPEKMENGKRTFSYGDSWNTSTDSTSSMGITFPMNSLQLRIGLNYRL